MGFLAKHAEGKGGPDTIFAFGAMAAKRASEIGSEKVVNATVGALLNPDGSLSTLNSVESAIRAVPFQQMANYAPINGLPGYIEAMIDSVFREWKPQAPIGGVATPGGTGALHNTFFNYLNEGDTCVTTSYYWGNYRTLLEENGRKLRTFEMFTPDDAFNLDACKKACEDVIQEQDNLMLLLNTPAHNPTGYSVSDAEWETLLEDLKALSRNYVEKHIILVLDVAYIDFSGPDSRRFFKLFENLPENMLVVVSASTSKGYTMYGFRLGCAICIAPNEAVRDEFVLVNGASARSTWSNCSRPAMEAIMYIYEDIDRLKAFRQELDDLSKALARRAAIFAEEARDVGLKICPYRAGFFVYVPTKDHADAEILAKELRTHDIFVVPLGEGIRIAICAIDEEKIKGIASKCKDAMTAHKLA